MISYNELRERMDTAVLVDVREPAEFSAGHIPHAHNLPVGQLRRSALTKFPDLQQPIIVYCLSGARSATACTILVSLGYTQVYDFGGISRWEGALEECE